MSKREVLDRRWQGVELPSLHRVLVRVHGEEEASAYREKAERAILTKGRYKEWVAVKTEWGQITGYRRANPKEWFFVPEAGQIADVEGPFRTKNLIKSRLRVKSTKTRSAGIYSAHSDEGWFVVFTRDRADSLFGEGAEEKLP